MQMTDIDKIVVVNEDWSDEFSYPIIMILTTTQFQKFHAAINKLDNREYVECYFGTNEAFELMNTDFRRIIKTAVDISETEKYTLKKFGMLNLGTNIYDDLLEAVGMQ